MTVRVLVLLPLGVSFGHDWADAAATQADVVRLQAVAAVHDPIDGRPPWLGATSRPGTYEHAVGLQLPWRLFGRYADVPDALRLVKTVRAIAEMHGRIDVLHAHFYANARSLPWVSRRLRIPFVLTEHSSALTGQNPDLPFPRRSRRIARRVYASAAAVLPVSASLEAAIQGHRLPGRRRVIPNPVDTRLFAPGAAPAPPPHRLLTVARLVRAKQLDALLRALEETRRHGVDAHLTIAGDGPLEAELRSLASALAIADHVEFVGRLSRQQVAAQMQKAHAFVLPSITENLPVAVIEARCSGLPIVATAVGGLPELVDARAGRLVAPGDPSALAAAIIDVLRTPPAELDLATTEARRLYSFAHVGQLLHDLYLEVSDIP